MKLEAIKKDRSSRSNKPSSKSRQERPRAEEPAPRRRRGEEKSVTWEIPEDSEHEEKEGMDLLVMGTWRKTNPKKDLVDIGRLRMFDFSTKLKTDDQTRNLLLFICEYDKWAKDVNATCDHAWTEFRMKTNSSTSSRLVTAMETLRGFESNTPWVTRISKLLVTTLPNNTDGTLREEMKNWKYVEVLEYYQHINLLNNLLRIMDHDVVRDRELILGMQESMKRNNKATQSLRAWIGYKNTPENRNRDFTFTQAYEYILGLEVAQREYRMTFAPGTQDRGNRGNPIQVPLDNKGNGNQNGNQNGNGNSNRRQKALERMRKVQAKYGDLCPNDGCRRREKTQAEMDNHLKSCKGHKTTKTNMVKIETLKVNVAKLRLEKHDYLPMVPVSISKGPEPEEKKEIVKTMFVDSWVYALQLVGLEGFGWCIPIHLVGVDGRFLNPRWAEVGCRFPYPLDWQGKGLSLGISRLFSHTSFPSSSSNSIIT